MNPADALERLLAGNRRFLADPSEQPWESHGPLVAELLAGQSPFAAVLGCSDSRVPVEAVFNQGPGQLFVVRVAGNVATSTQVASLEFAVHALGVRLVLVLGHSGCGAVSAALSSVQADAPDDLRDLIGRIAIAIPSSPDDDSASEEDLLDRAVRTNVEAVRQEILARSGLLAGLHRSGELRIVGAVYDIGSGAVEILEKGDGEQMAGPTHAGAPGE